MLEYCALSRGAQIQIGRVFWVLLIATKATLASSSLVERAFATDVADHGEQNPVFADVQWVGPCGDRIALERAMSRRGAVLKDTGKGASITERERFSVVVDVHSSTEVPRYVAELTLSSESGARDVRVVEADRCAELHSAIAWVLVVLARGPREGDESRRALSSATTAR